MSQHGTATGFTLGQYNEILTAIQRALPNALEGMEPKYTITTLGQHGQDLGTELQKALRRVIFIQHSMHVRVNYSEANLDSLIDGAGCDNVHRDIRSNRFASQHKGCFFRT